MTFVFQVVDQHRVFRNGLLDLFESDSSQRISQRCALLIQLNLQLFFLGCRFCDGSLPQIDLAAGGDICVRLDRSCAIFCSLANCLEIAGSLAAFRICRWR